MGRGPHPVVGVLNIGVAVVAVLEPDGEHARQGLVDVAVAKLHRAPVVAQNLRQDLHERLVLSKSDPAWVLKFLSDSAEVPSSSADVAGICPCLRSITRATCFV